MQLLLYGDNDLPSDVNKHVLELPLISFTQLVGLIKKDSNFCLTPDCHKSPYSSPLACRSVSCWVLGLLAQFNQIYSYPFLDMTLEGYVLP